jgi:hypothetical protein
VGFGSDAPSGHFGSVDQQGNTGGGIFPGFGGPPPAIAASSQTGSAATASHSDHTHEGVHSVNGLLGDVFINGVTSADSVNTTGAKLSSVAAANLTSGALAWVGTVGAPFMLRQGALTVDHITVETASGKAGYQWVRVDWFNRNWVAQTTYVVDGQNTTGIASDENTGLSSASPLLTLQEVSRRLAFATIPTGVTVNVTLLSSCLTTDKVLWTWGVQPGAASGTGVIVTGTPTVIYTGSVTGFVQQVQGSTPTATDNELTDSAIPSSYTASGLVASGLIYQRTNGTAAWWFPLKDLGSKTLRMSDAVNAGGNTILALAVNDTYTVSTLPKVYDQNFTTTSRVAYSTFVFVDDNSTTPATPQTVSKNDPNIVVDRSTFSTTREIGNAHLKNVRFGAAVFFESSAGVVRFDCGAVAGVNAIVGDGCTWGNLLNVHFQGGSLSFNGVGNSASTISFYDTVSDGLIIFNGNVSIQVIKGLGNAGKLLRASDYAAVIGYQTVVGAPVTPASSSDALPIQAGNPTNPGTSIAPAALPLTAQLALRGLGVVLF